MATDSDWRLRGQEQYLTGLTLIRRAYRRYAKNPNWDHDHCEFCWTKFAPDASPDVLHEGYCTEDEYHWVCTQCFNDFQDRFQWSVIKKEADLQAGESENQSA